MIPAGFETKNGKNNFMFDEDDEEFEDEYEFDFGSNKQPVNNIKTYSPQKMNENNYKFGTSNAFSGFGLQASASSNSEEKIVKQSDIVFKLNKTYYFNEFDFMINDLKSALLNKNPVLVKSLFDKHNINLNCKLNSNWTPLMYSVSCGSYEITKFLIEKGADVKFEDGNFFRSFYGCLF